MQKNSWLGMLLLGCVALLLQQPTQAAVRGTQDLSPGWRFQRADVAGADSPDYREDDRWQAVNLPHTWNTHDTFDDEPGYHRGIGWYRRSFTVPQDWQGKRIVLRFEAACSVATVWVNGELLGQHKGAWTPFEFDITRLVKTGSDNLVAVRVDNRWRRDVPAHDMDFNFMGGLHREVFLIATDPLYIASTRVTTPEVSESAAVVALETEVHNTADQPRQAVVVAEIQGPGLAEPLRLASEPVTLAAGATTFVKQQSDKIPQPKLWSPEEPNLYQVAFRLEIERRPVDDAQSPLGFRWYRFDPNEGFFLNGKPLKLKGVNRHDDYPGLGWAIPHSRQIADLKLIKELGANFVRTAHYSQHPIVLETCDRLGLMVWEEVPLDGEGVQGMKLGLMVGAEDCGRTIKQILRETIRRDRNHPSIILWSMGNENTEGPDLADWKAVAELTRQLNRVSKEEDPTRPTAVAINKPERAKQAGLTEAVDVLGYNIYAGWYIDRIEDFPDRLAAFHRDNPTKPIIISEYGADMERGRHRETPVVKDISEEYGCRYHESYWKTIAERRYVSGSLIWNVFDFGVERRLRSQSIPHLNQKGVFTYERVPKDVYYFYRSVWTDEPMAYIVSHTWTERKAAPTPIRVYSNGDTVELLHNGQSLGTKSKEEGFLWTVPLTPGNNRLEAKAVRQGKPVVDTLEIQGH